MDSRDNVSKALVLLAEKKLTRRQKLVLIRVYELGGYRSMTGLAERLSRELKMPISTAKWCLRELRDMMLLKGGSAEEKGVKCMLTPAGLLVAKHLKKRIF